MKYIRHVLRLNFSKRQKPYVYVLTRHARRGIFKKDISSLNAFECSQSRGVLPAPLRVCLFLHLTSNTLTGMCEF